MNFVANPDAFDEMLGPDRLMGHSNLLENLNVLMEKAFAANRGPTTKWFKSQLMEFLVKTVATGFRNSVLAALGVIGMLIDRCDFESYMSFMNQEDSMCSGKALIDIILQRMDKETHTDVLKQMVFLLDSMFFYEKSGHQYQSVYRGRMAEEQPECMPAIEYTKMHPNVKNLEDLDEHQDPELQQKVIDLIQDFLVHDV